MKTTSNDSSTRDRLLDAAQALMLSKGYTATSVEEICTAAGLTKGSFFHYFEGKEHLGRAVAERFSASMRQVFESAPYHQEKEPLDRVYGRVEQPVSRGGIGRGRFHHSYLPVGMTIPDGAPRVKPESRKS